MRNRTNIIISCLVGAAVLLIFALRGTPSGPPMALGQERIPPGEAARIAEIDDALSRSPIRPQNPAQCARAVMTVIDNLEPRQQFGVFGAGQSYPVWLHLQQSDSVSIFSLKLRPPSNEQTWQQDFVLYSTSQFGVADVFAFQEFVRAATIPAIDIDTTIAPSRWWSVLPYRHHQDAAVKYAVRQCQGDASIKPGFPREDAPACFEFMLQFQVDGDRMPIENASVRWDEVESAFQPIALIQVPAQEFRAPALAETCAQLAFDPWRGHGGHQPLGGLNRLFKVAPHARSLVR